MGGVRLPHRLCDQREFDHDPAVFIGRRGLAGAKLTPSEVRQLAHDLLLVASEIEGKV